MYKEHFGKSLCSGSWKEVEYTHYHFDVKEFSVFSSGGHFVQWSKIFLALLVGNHIRKIHAVV